MYKSAFGCGELISMFFIMCGQRSVYIDDRSQKCLCSMSGHYNTYRLCEVTRVSVADRTAECLYFGRGN